MRAFVTAASSNHFKSVCQFLSTIPGERIVFYDIGLTTEEAQYIQNTFQVVYRVFPFEKYPKFVHLTSQDAGAYAWKPIIIAEVYSQLKDGILIWSDAGNMISDVNALVGLIQPNGIYTGTSADTIKVWTHPIAIQEMGIPFTWFNYPMRNAALVGFVKNPRSTTFINDWKNMALNKNISLPPGANRSNHRWDQSILTFLYYKYDIPRLDIQLGYSIHNDIG